MKKINILMIGILFFISACEKQQNEFFLNSHDASLVALDYLLLSDNQYVLNLSQDDAAILGISEFDYKRILQEINNANDEILKHKNDACFIIANPECPADKLKFLLSENFKVLKTTCILPSFEFFNLLI